MSQTRALKRIIDDAASNLSEAGNTLENTPRPNDVCRAHDALFAVSKAQTNGILALLRVESSRLESEANSSDDDTQQAQVKGPERWLKALSPYRWPVALICFSPFAGGIVEKVLKAFTN